MQKKYLGAISVLVGVASLAGVSIASAQTTNTTPQNIGMGQGFHGMHDGRMGMMGGPRPMVIGTVTAINGNSLTVSTTMPSQTTSTSMTVDGTNAKVVKNGTDSTISAIAVGDTVMVSGTTTGTNVVAKLIRDGVMPKGFDHGGNNKPNPANLPAGNGQPIVGGSVTSISGNTISITNKAGAAYTIDATNAKINKPGVTAATITNISTGDMLLVQGTVNGNAITATTIMDQGSTTTTPNAGSGQTHPGIFGKIGGFFAHLFGW